MYRELATRYGFEPWKVARMSDAQKFMLLGQGVKTFGSIQEARAFSQKVKAG